MIMTWSLEQLKNSNKKLFYTNRTNSILRGLGFQMNYVGSALFENMVLYVVDELRESERIDFSSLYDDLEDNYSSLMTFVDKSLDMINYSEVDDVLFKDVYGFNNGKLDCYEMAISIGCYVLGKNVIANGPLKGHSCFLREKINKNI